MRIRLLLLLFVLALINFSCSPDKVEQGELTYSVTYPHVDASGFTLAMLPDEMTLTFKGTKVLTTIKKGKLFTTQILTDEADKSVEMRLTLGKEKLIYCILTPEEIEKLKASQPVYALKDLSQEDSVAGLWSKKYEVTCATDSFPHEPAWFTEALTPANPYWFTSYGGTPGVPLGYDVQRYGVLMRLDAQKFKAREVSDKEFERDSRLQQVSFDQYEAEAQELFDILME